MAAAYVRSNVFVTCRRVGAMRGERTNRLLLCVRNVTLLELPRSILAPSSHAAKGRCR